MRWTVALMIARSGTLVALALAAAACDSTTPADDEPIASAFDVRRGCTADAPATKLPADQRASLKPMHPADYHGQLAALSLRVPGGWGGYWLDDGRPMMALVDPTQKEATVAALRAAGFESSLENVEVKKVRWSYVDLYDWREYIRPVENRILLGAPDQAALTRLEGSLVDLDVPCFLVTTGIATFQNDDARSAQP
jgi:hypothetical protein